jgi:hypothetical protein
MKISTFVRLAIVPLSLLFLPSCVAGSAPEDQGDDALGEAPAALRSIVIDGGPIVFRGGVPVGGWSKLTVWPDGTYQFSGHLHDSGATSYDVSVVWGLQSSKGTVFQFSTRGRVHGTFESGSRDYDWSISGHNRALARAWSDLEAGHSWSRSAGAHLNLAGLWRSVKEGLSEVKDVVAVVGPLLL